MRFITRWKTTVLHTVTGALGVSLMALLPTAPAYADEFYAGKTITIYVGFSAGGGYDTYARALIQHWGDHIPGNPDVTIENMAGAGSLKAANFIYEVAPQDGTNVALAGNLIPMSQVLGLTGDNYDASKAQWIGGMVRLNGTIVVSDTSPAQTLDEAKGSEVVLASTGKTSETYFAPILVNAVLDTQFRPVTGYPGAKFMDQAIDNGEVQGRGGSWSSFVFGHPDWVEAGRVKPLVQIGPEKSRFVPEDTPLLLDLVTDGENREIVKSFSSYALFGRAPFVGPDVPADRVEILRAAFDATMQDPAFIETTKKLRLDIDPVSGDVVQDAAEALVNMSDARAKSLREALGVE